jgi:hypothetical protein
MDEIQERRSESYFDKSDPATDKRKIEESLGKSLYSKYSKNSVEANKGSNWISNI